MLRIERFDKTKRKYILHIIKKILPGTFSCIDVSKAFGEKKKKKRKQKHALQNENRTGLTAARLARAMFAYHRAIKEIKIKIPCRAGTAVAHCHVVKKKIIKDLDVCRQNREQLLAYVVIFNLSTILLQ